MELKDYINWDKVMKAERYAGGHSEIMDILLRGEVIASYIEDEYQGTEGFVYRLSARKIVLINDYFGSCCGCDAWEDAGDNNIKELVLALINNATVVKSIPEAIAYLEEMNNIAEGYDWKDIARPLIDQLKLLIGVPR